MVSFKYCDISVSQLTSFVGRQVQLLVSVVDQTYKNLVGVQQRLIAASFQRLLGLGCFRWRQFAHRLVIEQALNGSPAEFNAADVVPFFAPGSFHLFAC